MVLLYDLARQWSKLAEQYLCSAAVILQKVACLFGVPDFMFR